MGVKAGRQHQHIQLMQATINCANTVGLNALDCLDNQRSVWLLNRVVKPIRHHQPLAADFVVGRQFAPKVWFANFAL